VGLQKAQRQRVIITSVMDMQLNGFHFTYLHCPSSEYFPLSTRGVVRGHEFQTKEYEQQLKYRAYEPDMQHLL
jgi:hypothetical protein